MSALPDRSALAAALQRALLADDHETAERARDEGRRLVLLLVGLLRNSRMGHEAAIDSSAAEVAAALGRLLDVLGVLTLGLGERGVELNGLALRFRAEDEAGVAQLVQELGRHQVGGLALHAALDPAAVRNLGRALAEPARPGRARAALAERLAGLPSVELRGRPDDEPAPAGGQDPWTRAGQALRQAYAALAADRQPDLRLLHHVADDLERATRSEPERALATPVWALTLSWGERHVLATASLALRLGQQLGLDARALSDLGLAALLCAAGAAGGARDDVGPALRRLAVPRGFREGKLRRLLGRFDQQRPFDDEHRPHLYARLLRLCADYDRLTAERPQRPRLAPPMAQGALWAARGTLYDPELLALFVQTLGLYPPGSLLELSDARGVIVLCGGRDAERFSWPRVKVLRAPEGQEAGSVLDLYETRESLRPKRVLNPGSLPFEPASLWPEPVGRPAPGA